MRLLLAALALGLLAPACAPERQVTERLSWGELPPLPDTPRYGGPFVGVHAGVLLVAGGANFPDGMPWEGGKKVWYPNIRVLEQDAQSWFDAGELPGPLAYGAAVSTTEGIAILGGSDAEQHHAAESLAEQVERQLLDDQQQCAGRQRDRPAESSVRFGIAEWQHRQQEGIQPFCHATSHRLRLQRVSCQRQV